MDPGALGTLIIGLRAVDAELELDGPESEPERETGRPRRQVRAALATALRSLADRLEPASRETQAAQ
jgi:hypothetical protein